MRFSVLIPAIISLGLSSAVARGDSNPVVEPLAEPVDASPIAYAVEAPVVAAPVATSARRGSSTRPVPARVEPASQDTRVRVVAPAAEAPVSAAPASAPARVAAAKQSTQTQSAYYVNRVKFSIPAGVKVQVKKDWYTKDVTLEYVANPYTDWQGITPLAFTFTHTGTTLEVRHATPKYLPKFVTIRVPVSVEVIVP